MKWQITAAQASTSGILLSVLITSEAGDPLQVAAQTVQLNAPLSANATAISTLCNSYVAGLKNAQQQQVNAQSSVPAASAVAGLAVGSTGSV